MKEYENIVEDIKSKIINNELVTGDKLPSIKKMTEIYHVSSITVRNSLSILANEGYIITKERSGCFVKESQNDMFFLNFNELTNIKVPILSTSILGISQVYDFNGINKIDKKEHNDIQTVKFSRTFNSYLDAPVAYDIKYLIHHYKGDIKKLIQDSTLIQIDNFLEKDIMKTLEMTIIKPTQDIIDVLKITDETPVFSFKQKYYNKQNQLILFGRTYAIADSIKVAASNKLTP